MTVKVSNEHDRRAVLVHRLIRETAISTAQATDLVTLIGMDWNSLMREARLLQSKR